MDNNNYLGQESTDRKIDKATSSRIWSKNSAFEHASSGESILLGFNYNQFT